MFKKNLDYKSIKWILFSYAVDHIFDDVVRWLIHVVLVFYREIVIEHVRR